MAVRDRLFGCQPSADLGSQLLQKRSCLCYAPVYVGFKLGQSVDVLEPCGGCLLLRQGGASADGDDRNALGGSGPGNAHGGLAQQALFVQAAFAGDHQVGAGQAFCEVR